MIWGSVIGYSIILIFAIIGIISLVMSYEYMKRSHLVLAGLSILAGIGVFIKIGATRESVGEAMAYFSSPTIMDNLHYYIIAGIVLIFGLLHAEGAIHWVWRRVHPQSAPTDDIKAMSRGQSAQPGQAMPSTLMGSSTGMFSVVGLDVKTVALIRLSLFALKNFNNKTIIGIESHLKLGDGRRYRAFHKIVAETQTSRIGLTDIVHPYWRAINGNHAAARKMFAELCKIVGGTGQAHNSVIDRIVEIGQALGLSPRDMGVAISQLRSQ